MFSTPMTLANDSAVNKSFSRLNGDTSSSNWFRTDTDQLQPCTMSVKHSVVGPKGGKQVDRHLLSFAWTVNDAAGVPGTAIVNLTITLPRYGGATAATVKDLLAFVRNFTTASSEANVTSLLISET